MLVTLWGLISQVLLRTSVIFLRLSPKILPFLLPVSPSSDFCWTSLNFSHSANLLHSAAPSSHSITTSQSVGDELHLHPFSSNFLWFCAFFFLITLLHNIHQAKWLPAPVLCYNIVLSISCGQQLSQIPAPTYHTPFMDVHHQEMSISSVSLPLFPPI